MKFARIIFHRDTFMPGSVSKEISSRQNDFAAPYYVIEKDGDCVRITRDGETNVVPWCQVVGALFLPEERLTAGPTPDFDVRTPTDIVKHRLAQQAKKGGR